MAVQAIITNVIKDPDAVVVEMVFTDNQTFKKPKEYRLESFNLNAFKQLVQSEIDKLSQLSADPGKDLPLGVFDPSIATVPLTPAQLFAIDVQKLAQFQRLIDLGVIDKANTDYQAQLAKTIKDYDPSFIG